MIGDMVVRRESNDRHTAVHNVRAIAEIGVANIAKTSLAVRGDRLCPRPVRFESRDTRPDAFTAETLEITEVNTDGLIIAQVVVDPDDFEAAFEELDASYLAGEGAAHANTWSLIARTFAALNRRELVDLPETTADYRIFDHRLLATIEAADLTALMRATWDLTPELVMYVEAVHLLNDRGVVITQGAHGTSAEGFDAQWRMIQLLTVEDDLGDHCELFDEKDIDAAIARFDELCSPAPQLENSATRVYDRLRANFAARDWVAIAEILAERISTEDRRRAVNAGIQQGRDATLRELSALAEIGVKTTTSDVIAIRGERLLLSRSRSSGRDPRPDAFHTEVLDIIEIDADERIAARVVFDPDDIDAAFAELDARYGIGEAAPYAQTWSVIAGAFSAVNSHELPKLMRDWVNIDHRRAIAATPGDLTAYIRATLDDALDLSVYIESVHRLTNLGALVTQASHGTSRQGFDAEWRMISISTVDGDRINRGEIFDETDLEAALARFEELHSPPPRLENAASQVIERFQSCFAARDWAGMAALLADDISTDDRRRVVSAASQKGRDVDIENMQALADIGVTNMTSTVIATRGVRLALSRARMSGRDQRPEAFHTEVLNIVEIDTVGRIVEHIAFDLDDIDAAFEELDARYLAGEATAHAQTWAAVRQVYAALNRGELPATTPDWVNIDHRRGTLVETGDILANVRATWDLAPEISRRAVAVHRLNDLGAVVTHTANGTTHEGFDVEWRLVLLGTYEGDLLKHCELFDETDLDVALARFDELSRPVPRLENAASQLIQRFRTYFLRRDWEAVTELLADDTYVDDRRPVVNYGLLQGVDSVFEALRVAPEIGLAQATSTVIATRGRRVALVLTRFITQNQRSEAFQTEMLNVVEINADNQISANVVFGPDDFEAAIAELDARYRAGEGAGHANTLSAITQAYAALSRNELPPRTPDSVDVDHRRVTTLASGDLTADVRAAWSVAPNIKYYVENVHRLSNLGAVVTHAAFGTSQEGFDAEWRGVDILTVEGDMVSRAELFDEADIDVAIARFDELCSPAPQLENAASRVNERLWTCFTARDWIAIAEMVADDFYQEDRRRVVNVGTRYGRDAALQDARATADLGIDNVTPTVIATRGECLVLARTRYMGRGHGPDGFRTESEALNLFETNADNRIAAVVVFEPDDIEAAFAELDARYLAGEGAAHAHTWSVIARAHSAFNRRELPAVAPDFFDHRPVVTVEAGDPTANIRDMWDFTPDLRIYVETVHRLSDLGAVLTQVSRGTSQGGFEAEWRVVEVVTVEDDLVKRAELFDETDLDAALARFDELSRPAQRLENAASRVDDRFEVYFAARDWDAMAELMADDISIDDRRRVVNAGLRRGRDVEIANMRAIADLGTRNATSAVIATRGERLALSRNRFVGRDLRPEAFHSEALCIIEIDADERIVARVSFDPDDFDAAFAELDARYVAGESAAYAHTWSVVAQAYAALIRHELPPTTPDWVNLDHRRGIGFAPGDMTAYIRAKWELEQEVSNYIEDVHRLNNLGAVFTQVLRGTTQQDFDAEWRLLELMTVEGDLISRAEIFDEADIGAALARFDELSRPTPRLENAASRTSDRLLACFVARDWDAIAAILAEDVGNDDRRPMVGSGVRHGRDAEIANMRSIAAIGIELWTSEPIATRGERLVLSRHRFSRRDERPHAFVVEVLGVTEINGDNQITAVVAFGPDDIDAAIQELDARYRAGEAAANSNTWSVIARAYAALNRRELPAIRSDWANIDHRRATAFAPGDGIAYIRATFDLADLVTYMETVHRLTDLGAVVTSVGTGISQEDFSAEWRLVGIVAVEGDLISRCEIFEEADLDAALARFDELERPAQ